MYRLIVERRVREIFQRLNEGDYEHMVGSLAPRFTYRFYGEHALGGERRTVAAMRAWWRRFFRLFPDARFEPQAVLVAGWPWSTRIATDMIVRATLTGGTPYENVFSQFVHLRWGRITEVRTLEDTQKLERALRVMAAAGVEEATAAPITDAEPGLTDHVSRRKGAT